MSDDKPTWGDVMGKLAEAGHKYMEEEQARRDSLTPEQQQAELREEQRQADLRKHAKTEKQYEKYREAFLPWSKRDLWTPEEFAYLLHGEKPTEWDAWPSDQIEETITTIKRCLGESLPNSSTDPKAPMILRTACLTWWKDYVKPHPFWLRAIGEITPAIDQPQTAKANEARKTTKEIRQQRLGWFFKEIDRRATNYNWDRTCIPATKQDILDVFLKVCPNVNKISVSTFSDELPQFGAKCQHGVKHNINNRLTKLFAAEIRVNKPR